ncbi:MAG: ABC transporter permease [Verrucomicrobiae bacterium]|nr:ABC transporter permease [Verrucomicrobiae bacterium]
MRTFWILYKRELAAFMLSPIAYVLATLFQLIMGFMFVYLAYMLMKAPREETVTLYFFNMFWLPSLVIPSLITMRLFAEENRSGTIEMLMTAPVNDWQVALSKFGAALSVYVGIWLPTLLYIFILRMFVGNPESLEIMTFLTAYLLIFLNSAFLIAAGTFTSSLTRNQIIAAILSFVLCFLFLILPVWVFDNFRTGPVGETMLYLSAFNQLSEFARGVIDVKPFVLYLTGTFYFLYATVRVIESRKWR